MEGQALPGFRDFYPEDLAIRNYIFATWRQVAARYGFQEYDGPPLEPLELYTEKSGNEIAQQLYTFEDKGGRLVALRPEMTPTLARMVGAHASALKKPIRWFSIPQLFRYERPQKGRLREHFQLNMDIIGESGSLADAEVIAAAIDIMRALGLGSKDFRVRLSDREAVSRRLRMCVKIEREAQVIGALAAFDKYERDKKHAAELLQQVFPGDPDSVANALAVADELANPPPSLWNLGKRDVEVDEETLAVDVAEDLRLGSCLKYLNAMGLGDFVDVDFRIVRGLAYYTGIVFEVFDTGKELRAICGGGRYDGLLKQISGIDLPCVGFGMGDVVLAELLKERGATVPASGSLDAFLIAVSGQDVAPVIKLAHELRDQGLGVEYALRNQPIRKQLELAAARGAARAVIIGPDERQAGVAVVRDLATGVETRVPLGAIAPALRRDGAGRG